MINEKSGEPLFLIALREGSLCLKNNFLPLLLGGVVIHVVLFLVGYITDVGSFDNSDDNYIKSYIIQTAYCFLISVLMLVMLMSLIKMCHDAFSGKKLDFADIYSGFSYVQPVFLITIGIMVYILCLAALGLGFDYGVHYIDINFITKSDVPFRTYGGFLFLLFAFFFVPPKVFIMFCALAAGDELLQAYKKAKKLEKKHWTLIMGLFALCMAVDIVVVMSIPYGIGTIIWWPWLAAIMTAAYLQIVKKEGDQLNPVL